MWLMRSEGWGWERREAGRWTGNSQLDRSGPVSGCVFYVQTLRVEIDTGEEGRSVNIM